MRRLKYATFCSGIECMSAACEDLPMDPVFFSEIEPFPCAVLKSHFPNVPNLGDMSKIRVNEKGEITNGTTTVSIPDGGIDILAAGCPCQDFSVAGKRAGGEEGSGTRSSLIFEFIRIISEIRPRYFIYENVPGMFTTNQGRDFAHILMAFRDIGYGCAWRVLDAQYVRVDRMERAIPQRRRRVWVVGHIGGDVAKAAEILFEHKSIVGDTPPRRRTGQENAHASQDRNQVHDRVVGEARRDTDIGVCCRHRPSKEILDLHSNIKTDAVAISYDGYNQSAHNEVCYPLRTMNGSEGDDRTPKVAASYGINPQGGQMLPFDHECGETLAIGHQGGVMTMQEPRNIADIISQMRYIVRRLTPTECCRLMGLPDGWTIPSNLVITDELVEEFRQIHDNFNRIMAEYEGGKPPKPKSAKQVRAWLEKIANPATCPDAPRYKGCGNGWATNQPRWIVLRMLAKENINPWEVRDGN